MAVFSPERYRTIGLGKYAECEFSTTANIASYTLPEPVPARSMEDLDKGKPVKKRPDYPEMSPQSHLDEETRLAFFIAGVGRFFVLC